MTLALILKQENISKENFLKNKKLGKHYQRKRNNQSFMKLNRK
jgi:hypothetical protein